MEGLQIRMNKFRQKGSMTDEDFMIHILNNLPEEYDVILDALDSCLMVTRDDVLTINVIHEKSNHRYKKIKVKKKKLKKKRP